jgi:Phosphate uptake regulator
MTVFPRRLQRLGTTTLVVSLPRQWVTEVGLKAGDIVYLETDSDRVTIHAKEVIRESRGVILNADEIERPEVLKRLIVACFLQGYDEVKIVSEVGLTETMTQEALATVEQLPGYEVVEQTPRQMTLQAIVDATKFKVETMLRRLNVLITSMMTAAIDALARGAVEKVGEVATTGKKVEELYFLVVRQLILALRNPSLAQSVGIDSPIAALGYRLVAKAIEEASQHSIALAKESLNIRHKGPIPKRGLVNRMVALMEEVQLLFGNSVNAFLSLDLKAINSVLDRLPGLKENIAIAEKELIEEIDDPDLSVSLRASLMHFSAILDACEMVTEVALNKFVRMGSKIIYKAAT